MRLPAFPCRKMPQPPREDAPVERDGIGLNLSALERNRTADCSAGYPARPEWRPSSAPQKRKRERHGPSPLPSVQPQGVPGITPTCSAVNTGSETPQPPREDAMLEIPAFPCRKTPLPPREDAPVERDGIGLNLSALERNRTADCSAGCPARPERRPSSAPQKRKRERHGPSPLPSVQPV